jgi:hypothetical protein
MLHKLRRSTTPNIEIAIGDVIEPELQRLAASRLKTR